jgi:putative nucleotidyltransferase with HDIG domain
MLAAVKPDIAQSVLVALLESRLPETYDHSHRVARSAAALARTLQLAPIEIRDVRAAALLHDIGKVAFPPRLLGSGGALSNDEVVALQRHVEIAADLLAGVETLSHLAPVVGASQERYDGTGQPGRLAGDAIPVGARIIAVADVYDRLTARRSHDDPMSHDDASAELVRMAGSHLDPDVVRAWMNLVESYRCY